MPNKVIALALIELKLSSLVLDPRADVEDPLSTVAGGKFLDFLQVCRSTLSVPVWCDDLCCTRRFPSWLSYFRKIPHSKIESNIK